jgi:threonine/homoserine/homoserine lactone efflux protein
MTVSLIVTTSLFALAASLSPGPVNHVSLCSSARYGLKTGLTFVTGATLGFVVLFLLIGFGLHYFIHSFIHALPLLTQVI